MSNWPPAVTSCSMTLFCLQMSFFFTSSVLRSSLTSFCMSLAVKFRMDMVGNLDASLTTLLVSWDSLSSWVISSQLCLSGKLTKRSPFSFSKTLSTGMPFSVAILRTSFGWIFLPCPSGLTMNEDFILGTALLSLHAMSLFTVRGWLGDETPSTFLSADWLGRWVD